MQKERLISLGWGATVLGLVYFAGAIVNAVFWSRAIPVVGIMSVIAGLLVTTEYLLIGILALTKNPKSIPPRRELNPCPFKSRADIIYKILIIINGVIFTALIITSILFISLFQILFGYIHRAVALPVVFLFVGFGIGLFAPIEYFLYTLIISYFKEKDYLAIQQAQDIESIAKK